MIQPYYEEAGIVIFNADCREALAHLKENSAHCCVTSPPYFGLRDYGNTAQIGLEKTPDEYVAELVKVFREVRRVLRDDGTLWLNLGDSYAGSNKGVMADGSIVGGSKQKTSAGTMTGSISKVGKLEGLKPKDLIGIPWRVAFALQADGWYLRQDIIWNKPNPMPESVTDRCTKAHEYIFLLSKSARYYFDSKAVAEPLAAGSDVEYRQKLRQGKSYDAKEPYQKNFPASFNLKTRNRRSVWTVATQPYSGAHFATFPPELIKPCIQAGCPSGGVVLDPFAGSGTTLQVARASGCDGIGIELNSEYCQLIKKRLRQGVLPLAA